MRMETRECDREIETGAEAAGRQAGRQAGAAQCRPAKWERQQYPIGSASVLAGEQASSLAVCLPVCQSARQAVCTPLDR